MLTAARRQSMTFFWILESVCAAFKLSTVASEEGGLNCFSVWTAGSHLGGEKAFNYVFKKINNNMYANSYFVQSK